MYKLLRIALFAAPLAGGAAWAQGSGTSGSAGAPGMPPGTVTDDTRTPLQQKAGRIDDTTPALPGDATKPVEVPNTVPESNRPTIPETNKAHKRHNKVDESTIERKSDTTRMQNKIDMDLQKDQLDSDK